ncbi:MAG: DUF421 domain-containing protein [Clostridia bacterium]|nr:DUF421 domain-containing protein [Clostridia bacterium]
MAVALIRTIVLYAFIIFAIKMMGKRQISDLQTSELVITILISNIAAIPMQNTAQPLLTGIIPILVLICCEILASFLMLKNLKIRQLICGKPIIVINEGKIDQKAMEYLRLSTEDLSEQLRQLDVFSLDDVWFAIMETNGQMSVMKKSEKQPPDAMTLKLKVPDGELETVVVSDGIISESSLQRCDLSKDWLSEIFEKEKVKLEEIFIMTAKKSKQYKIIKKEK